MLLIVGLGNPGSKYSETRHNVGRLVIERMACQHSLRFFRKRELKASFAQASVEGREVILAYPETFMNVSGEAVLSLARHFEVRPENDLLVVVDEVALPFGSLRLRAKGSAGGHQGLKSIETAIQTMHYARLRVGIGPEGSKNTGRPQGGLPLEEFVLMRFSLAERKDLQGFLDQAAQACSQWITLPIMTAMNVVNH